MADETCGALDDRDGALYYCTLPAGHEPADQHASEYREPDPDHPPFTRAAVHEWTEPL